MKKYKANSKLCSDSDLSHEKKFAEVWNNVCKDKNLDMIDRAIMKHIVDNPLATMKDIGAAINMSRNGVLRRLKRQPFIAAERVFEGSFTERMERIATKVAKRMEKMLDTDLDMFLERCREIATSDMEPGQQAAAYRYVEKEYDPEKVLAIGKIAMAFLAKQAELGLTKEAIDKGTLPSLQEARQILEADLSDE